MSTNKEEENKVVEDLPKESTGSENSIVQLNNFDQILNLSLSTISSALTEIPNQMSTSSDHLEKSIETLQLLLKQVIELKRKDKTINEVVSKQVAIQKSNLENIREITDNVKSTLEKYINEDNYSQKKIQSQEKFIQELKRELSSAIDAGKKTMQYLRDALDQQKKLEQIVEEKDLTVHIDVKEELDKLLERLSPLVKELLDPSTGESTVERYLSAIDQLDANNTELREEVEKLSLEMDEQRIKLHDSELLCQKLESDNKHLVEETNEHKLQSKNKINSLTEENLQIKLNLEELEDEKEEFDNLKTEYLEMKNDQEDQIVKLNQKIKEFESSITKLKSRNDNLKENLNKSTKNNKDLIQKIELLNEDIEQKEGELIKEKEINLQHDDEMKAQKEVFVEVIKGVKSKKISIENVSSIIDVIANETQTIKELASNMGKSELKCYTDLKSLQESGILNLVKLNENDSYKDFIVVFDKKNITEGEVIK